MLDKRSTNTKLHPPALLNRNVEDGLRLKEHVTIPYCFSLLQVLRGRFVRIRFFTFDTVILETGHSVAQCCLKCNVASPLPKC